ncbi:uncharacterized protein LOC134190874 [Corticium candelabrum]|uniref:uncharacterized protein LOC134190874 n=1 Tax=Corticium candelabrum TaxID=121492 RepID=UPI002E26EEE6|nr:uncharacterized protein LOC134190874 [Corticium candelabrum]
MNEDSSSQSEKEEEEEPGVEKYRRGEKLKNIEFVRDRKLRSQLKRSEEKRELAATRAAKAEVLLVEEAGYLEADGLEKTYKFTQKEIANAVDIGSAQKQFDLHLDKSGPYRLSYTINGRYLLIGGKMGHIATINWATKKLGCEVHVGETIRDVQYLHNETMFAVAQKKYLYIYDNKGVEIHCVRRQRDVNRLDFLPYHFLLVTVNEQSELKYQDVSTGSFVAEYKTRKGPCDVLTHNPYNAIVLLGHHNGVVSMWSPNSGAPLVKMLCHRGPVRAIAIDREGLYMATSGMDGMMKIWDIRTYKMMYKYITRSPAGNLDFSQRGLLAAGQGSYVNIWRDVYREKQKMPYMKHHVLHSGVSDLEFCPFEDVLGVGHRQGFSSLLVPGAGEPNFDALESNPYQTKKQRQEGEVKALLEKIQPELISLDPHRINKVDHTNREILMQEKLEMEDSEEKYEPRYKARGQSSSLRTYRRKQAHIEEQLKERKRKKMLERQKESREEEANVKRTALDRFTRKKL